MNATIQEPLKRAGRSTSARQFAPAKKTLHIRSILVPVDFSEPSNVALRRAASFARMFGAKLTLLHMVEPIVAPDLPYSCPLLMDMTEIVAQSKLRLERLARKQVKDATLIAKTMVVQGRSFQGIADTARTHKSDLIIISTHGYTGLKHMLLGSTTERVVRHAPCPVLVVRHDGGAMTGRGDKSAFKPRKILVPLDFSRDSMSALRYAAGFARQFHAELTLLNAVHPAFCFTSADGELEMYAELVEETRRANEQLMAGVLKEQQLKGLKVRSLVSTGDPRSEIVQTAARSGSGLIVLSTHGRTGLSRVLLGSVTERVAQHAPCDVLIVRQHEHEFLRGQRARQT